MMKLKLGAFCVFAFAAFAASAFNVSNKTVMVDQRGNLNAEGIASVQDVATNAVKAQVAEAKAEAAMTTARGVTDAIQGVVGNIMSNNVVVYRSGFIDGFAPLISLGPNDWLKILQFRPVSTTASSVVVDLDYVLSTDIGAVKPIVYASNSCTNRAAFPQVPDANVTSPVYTAESQEVNGQTVAGYYTVRVSIPNPDVSSTYFYWVEVDGDAPLGDGAALELPNGVAGGLTTEVTFGDVIITFEGGLGKAVRNAP